MRKRKKTLFWTRFFLKNTTKQLKFISTSPTLNTEQKKKLANGNNFRSPLEDKLQWQPSAKLMISDNICNPKPEQSEKFTAEPQWDFGNFFMLIKKRKEEIQ